MKKDSKKGLRDLRQPIAEPPAQITFPCDYSLKVVGDAAEDFASCVCKVVSQYAPDLNESAIQVVDSRNGRFQSVRMTIRATGEEQLRQLFEDLKATGRVHMVV